MAPDRWGYGLSDVPRRPSLPAFAADMAALMDHLGHRRFAVGGISGGGPYAAAVAACLAPRVRALALVSPVGPIADAGCAAVAVGPAPLLLHGAAALAGADRRHLRRFSAGASSGRRTWQAGSQPCAAAGSDQALIARPEIAARLLGSFREGLRPGMRGPVTDLALFSRPWGVDLARHRGADAAVDRHADKAVPLVAARALAQRIGGCSCEELKARATSGWPANYARVLEWIVATMRARQRPARR